MQKVNVFTSKNWGWSTRNAISLKQLFDYEYEFNLWQKKYLIITCKIDLKTGDFGLFDGIENSISPLNNR